MLLMRTLRFNVSRRVVSNVKMLITTCFRRQNQEFYYKSNNLLFSILHWRKILFPVSSPSYIIYMFYAVLCFEKFSFYSPLSCETKQLPKLSIFFLFFILSPLPLFYFTRLDSLCYTLNGAYWKGNCVTHSRRSIKSIHDVFRKCYNETLDQSWHRLN